MPRAGRPSLSSRRVYNAAMSSPLRRVGLNLALLLLSLLLSFTVAETFLRFFRPQPLQALMVWPDGTLRHRPSFRYTYVRAEFSHRIAWNAHGMRGPEILQSKSPQVARVIVLGDSFVEGKQVGDDEVLTSVMAAMARDDGVPLEVINLGVSGVGTAREIHLWEKLGRPLAPDIVVLGFYPNDVRNNAERGEFSIDAGRVTLLIEERASSNPLARARAWLAAHSHLYILIRSGQNALDEWLDPPTAIESEDVFARDPPERVRRGWEMTRALLSHLAQSVRETGARLVVVLIPTRFQVDDALWGTHAADLGLDPAAYDLRIPNRELGDWAAAEGVTFLDLLEGFRARNESNSFYYAGDAHWNADGHRLAAQIILEGLSQDPSGPASE